MRLYEGFDITGAAGSEFGGMDSGREREAPGLGSGRFGDEFVD